MQPDDENVDVTIAGTTEAMSEDLIATSLNAVRTRIAHHEHERCIIDRMIATAKEEERLLRRLLDLRRGRSTKDESSNGSGEELRIASCEAPSERQHPAVLAVIDELAIAGHPVHISELMRLLGQRRVVVPGAGSQANLIVHLRRDPRLMRTSRGMYGLAVWGLEKMEPRKRRPHKKRFRVTAGKQRD